MQRASGCCQCFTATLAASPAACRATERKWWPSHGLRSKMVVRRTSLASRCKATQTVQPKVWSATPLKPATRKPELGKADKQPKLHVVVLGSGWGAMSFLRNVDASIFADDGGYDLTVVSPRDCFIFTPLLPSVISGTVEEGTVLTPIDKFVHDKGSYLQATCVDIDPQARLLTVQEVGANGAHSEAKAISKVPYDVLILAVGSVSHAMGTQGVAEHCWFLKTMEDAHKGCIATAAQPGTTPEARKKLLSFVVVGGGPSGVEVAAELHDLVAEDVARRHPHIKDFSIVLVHSQDRVLGTFNEDVSRYAGKLLTREGVKLQLHARVQEVNDGSARVKTQDGSSMDLEFGTCVWTAGIAPNPLVESLKTKLRDAQQGGSAGLVVDSRLRVAGTAGSIIALGDAAITNQLKAAKHAEELFHMAPKNLDGRVGKKDLVDLLTLAGQDFPQLHNLALQLDTGLFGTAARALFPESGANAVAAKHMASMGRGLDLEQFRELLADADATARRLPPTAQVARQQGEYLAGLFSNRLVQRAQHAGQEGSGAHCTDEESGAVELRANAPPFMYVHLGSLVYLGMNRAVMELPPPFPGTSLKGVLAAELWRALELMMQVSAPNTWMLAGDFIHTRYFGRRMSPMLRGLSKLLGN